MGLLHAQHRGVIRAAELGGDMDGDNRIPAGEELAVDLAEGFR